MSTINREDHKFHQDCPIHTAGEMVGQAKAAMIMLHGRGATAKDILNLTGSLDQPGFTYIAPQAMNNTWYPNPFTAPTDSNEPWLSSALSLVGKILNQIIVGGIPLERIFLLGFSQGACLALEYSVRNPNRFGGLVGLSGALIGPDGYKHDTFGSLAGTPVFLGCSDVDTYVPRARVDQAAQILEAIGGRVTKRLYPGMGHEVNQDEIDLIQAMMRGVING